MSDRSQKMPAILAHLTFCAGWREESPLKSACPCGGVWVKLRGALFRSEDAVIRDSDPQLNHLEQGVFHLFDGLLTERNNPRKEGGQKAAMTLASGTAVCDFMADSQVTLIAFSISVGPRHDAPKGMK